MILSKALILKGLGGLAVIGGTVGLGVVGKERGWFGGSIDPALKELIEKVGLSCNLDNICTQVSGKNTNIKQETTLDDKTLTTTGTSGKIKVYKLSGESTEGYNEKFKFVIEEGDISINGDGTNKLEQFETYEIKEEGTDPSKKWYFSRKKKAEDEIKRLLGLPTDSSCTFPTTSSSPSTCSSIDVAKLKAINFEGKGTTDPTIDNSGSPTLKIEKITTDTTTFPLGYKFTFETDNNITIPKKINNENISIKKKTNTEFKIKVTPSSDTTPVSLSLEKAWTAKTLGEKVGLICTESSSTDKSCTFKDGSINVNNGNGGNTNSKIEGAKVKEPATNKKMTYLEDQEGHSQGIKFTVEGGTAIELTKDGNSTTLSIENNNASYEIKKDSGDSKWYLTKYTASAG